MGREKRISEAITEMETAVATSPDDADLRVFLGNLYLVANRRSHAAEQYAALKQLDPIAATRLYDVMSAGKVVNVSAFRP